MMCGFAGILSTVGKLDRSLEVLKLMGETLKFRGPDDQQLFSDNQLSFVFRRLSIVDIEKGTQPIWNDNKTVFIAVNGEIYNHLELKEKHFADKAFQTTSDSEIVLHLYLKYGEKIFDELNGMFAIAIWDSRNGQLILARDRLGIKPLYYSKNERGLIFGSELKALLVHPDAPRSLNWSDLVSPGLQDKENTPTYVDGISHFPAGCYAKFCIEEKTEFSIIPFWDIKDHLIKKSNITIAEAKNRYLSLVKDSLEKRLMADVPIGLFLSGGIDSSILAALAAKNKKRIHCFTVLESATYHSGDAKNAKDLCESYGLEFHPIVFSLSQMLNQFDLQQLEKMIVMIESPRFDLEWYYKSELHKAAKALVPELKVVLLGQGADEFTGGYSKYLGSVFNTWDEYIALGVTKENRESSMRSKSIPERFIENSSVRVEQPLGKYKEKMLRYSYQLQHFNLWHEDRTSSFFGMESRVPFLDHRIVELLAEIPTEFHQELFWNKKIVRNCAKEVINQYPETHPKVPFFVSDQNTTVEDFAIGSCKNIYQEFVTKYQSVGGLEFIDWENLEHLYNNSQKKNPESAKNAWELIELMCIVIFSQFCLTPKKYITKEAHSVSGHYPQLPLADWQNLEHIFSDNHKSNKHSLTASSKINISEECEILNPLTEKEGTTALALLCNGKQIRRIEIPDSHMWIVMFLDAVGSHIHSPKDIDFWACKLQKSSAEILPIINDLVNGGFLVKLENTKENAL